VAGAALVMLAGTLVTGSGPHAGDETAERLDLSVRGVAMVHSGLTWLFLAVVVLLAVRLRRIGAPAAMGERLQVLLTVVVLQGGIGYVQYATGVPELLVGLHVLGSMVVWVAAIRLRLTAVEPVGVPASDAVDVPRAPAAATRLSTSS
jgi:heme a synthase